jgi:hypothetical protein
LRERNTDLHYILHYWTNYYVLEPTPPLSPVLSPFDSPIEDYKPPVQSLDPLALFFQRGNSKQTFSVYDLANYMPITKEELSQCNTKELKQVPRDLGIILIWCRFWLKKDYLCQEGK